MLAHAAIGIVCSYALDSFRSVAAAAAPASRSLSRLELPTQDLVFPVCSRTLEAQLRVMGQFEFVLTGRGLAAKRMRSIDPLLKPRALLALCGRGYTLDIR